MSKEQKEEFKDKEWGTDRPATIRADRRTDHKEKGIFDWIYTNREKIIVDYFMQHLFFWAITLIYIGLVITIYDSALNWLLQYSPEFEFTWKVFFFAFGMTLLTGGFTILVWVILMAYYLKGFKWLRRRMEFIDPTQQLE